MKNRKTSIRFDSAHPAMTVFNSRYWARHMVYILRADKAIRYGTSRSRIVYIGETRRGANRPAGSVAAKAIKAFGKFKGEKQLHGVKKIDVHLLTFKGTQNIRIWEVLERDLLATFKEKYGKPPEYNKHGKGAGFKVANVSRFSKKRLLSIIESLS